MSNKINIKIKNERHHETKISVNYSDKIGDLKTSLNYDLKDRWRFEGEVLNNNKTIENYGIEEGDTITTSKYVPGGARD